MSHIRGVILDVDGTLVASNDAHAYSWVEAFRRGGYDATYEEVRPLIGMGGDKLIPKVAGVEKDSPQGKQLNEWWTEIFKRDYLPGLQPTRGAADLLKYMHDERGLKMVVATSANSDILEPLLEICGAKGLIKDKTSSSDAKESKPAPDIVHVALDSIGLLASEVIMLGDTPYDIESAGKAGVGVIAFRSGGWSDDGLEGALAIYDDPADLLEHYDQSPLGGNGTREVQGDTP